MDNWKLKTEEPDLFQPILMSINGCRGKVVRSGTYCGDGSWKVDNGEIWHTEEKELEAWMPLPKPYKGD